MEAPPVLFHSPLYRSFIIVLGKLLYEYRPNGVCHFLIIVRCVVCYMGSCRETSVELPTFQRAPLMCIEIKADAPRISRRCS